MTATLFATAVAEERTSWTAPVNDVLCVAGSGERALVGVTMRQLLNHTHGLDASAIDQAPRTREGRLDAQTLCEHLAPDPIAAPGQLYSYGDAGGWLAGAVLEKIYSNSYENVLSHWLIENGSVGYSIRRGDLICPATGENLSLTVQDWLQFLQSHAGSCRGATQMERGTYVSSLLGDQTPLPGWSPAENASCLGWKSYGTGWFGHNSSSRDTSSAIRFNPDQGMAIIVSAPGDAAFVTLATIFGRAIPEFYNFRVPRLLKQTDCQSIDWGRYTGTYVRARSSIVITQESPARLSYYFCGPRMDESEPARPLRIAADHVFIPSRIREFAFIQFVKAGPDLRFEYLWDGEQLWRHA